MAEQGPEFLQRAWREMQTPAPDADYERPDDLTQRSVDWVRQAWQESQPAAPVDIPWQVRLHARRSAAKSPLGLWAAAAALFLATSIWLHLELKPAAPLPLPEEPVEVATILNAGDGPAVVVASITPEHTELRSGPVRLILLPAQSGQNQPTDEEPR